MHQTCTGTKKPKKLKFPGIMGPLLSSCCFFLCLSMFGASSGFVFFVFFGACQCFWSQSRQTCTGSKKNKKPKPLDAPNLHRHQRNKKNWNFQELWVHFWVGSGIFGLFGFFGACRCLVHLVVCFFLVPVNVFVYLMSRSWWKNCVLPGF